MQLDRKYLLLRGNIINDAPAKKNKKFNRMKSPNIFPDPYVTLGTVEILERRGPKTTRKGWETIVGPRLRPHICCNGHVAFSNWLLTKTWLGTDCRSRVGYWNWTWGGSGVRVRVRVRPCPTTLAYTFCFLIGKQKKKQERERGGESEGERQRRGTTNTITYPMQCKWICSRVGSGDYWWKRWNTVALIWFSSALLFILIIRMAMGNVSSDSGTLL